MKKLKQLTLLFLAVLVFTTSCSDDDDSTEPQYQGEIPTVEKTAISVYEELEISYSKAEEDGFTYDITEGSDCVTMVEHDGTHYIKGLEPGTATLSLENKAGKSQVSITVTAIPSVETNYIGIDDLIQISNSSKDQGFSYVITQDAEYIEVVELEGMHYIKGLELGTASITLENESGVNELTITVGASPSIEITDIYQGNLILISNSITAFDFNSTITQDNDNIEVVKQDGEHYILAKEVGEAVITVSNVFGENKYTINVSYPTYTDSQGIIYNIDINNKTASVAGDGVNYSVSFTDEKVTIPVNVNFEGETYSVKSIEDFAFYDKDGVFAGNSSIKELYFANGSELTSIGDSAFVYCSNLSTIDFSNCESLTEIGTGTFYACDNLTGVDFTDCTSLTTIGTGAFYDCKKLESIDFTNCTKLAEIGEASFYTCEALKTVDFSFCESLQALSNKAFYECGNLETVNFTNCSGLKSIGEESFYSCGSLKSVDFTGCTSLTTIGTKAFKHSTIEELDLTPCTSFKSLSNDAFYSCANLATVNLSNLASLTTISENAFAQCDNLETVTLSNCSGLSTIESSAFYYCKSLKSVDLTTCTSLTTIGEKAFDLCDGGVLPLTLPGTGWNPYGEISSTNTGGLFTRTID